VYTTVRRFFAPLIIAILSVGVLAAGVSASQTSTGNGAPSGPNFNLNIHGVAKGQGFNGNNKNDIFVPLSGTCKIDLVRAPLYGTFSVLNPDCVNNPPAAFELPDPCVDATGATTCPGAFSYSVWARALSPRSQALMTTCYTDTLGATYCNTDLTVTLKKSQQFTNVSTNLLQVCLSSTGKQAAIFSDPLLSYFWNYDNQGLRLAQFRFYPIPTGTTIDTT
jgi:hypothetical protein